MHSSIQIISLAIALLLCDHIVAQDTTSEVLERLTAGSAQDVAAAISSLSDGKLEQPEIAQRLTLLLDDERAVVEHFMGRETVGDRAWYKLLDLPSTASISIVEKVPSLKTDQNRSLAFEAISRIGKPNSRAYALIVPYCSDGNVSVRAQAIAALSAVADQSDESVKQFGRLLLDSDPMVKWTVLDALDERHERIGNVTPEVIKLLDNDSEVYIAISNHASHPEKLRGRAARLLSNIGVKASNALPKLKKLTGPEYDKNVRIWSATAICKISDAVAQEDLDLLGQLLLDDMEHEWVQNDAPVAIAQLGPIGRPLIDSLEHAKKHKSAQIRRGLVAAFFAIDPDSAVSRCLPLMEDENELVAETVIEAFSERGVSEPRVIAAYIRALGKHDGIFDQPANSAVDALGKIGPAAIEALPALRELAQDPDVSDTLKEAVADALRRIH